MKNTVSKLKLDDYFVFTGPINNRQLIAKIFARSNINFMLSAYDTASLSISEAASQYTPSICLKGTIVSSIIKNNFNGYLTTNSPIKAAKIIYENMDKNKKYNEICQQAHSTLFKTWNEICKNVLVIYKKCLLNFNN
jgi:glycosyltransferase involved in cell wall biosynthesis